MYMHVDKDLWYKEAWGSAATNQFGIVVGRYIHQPNSSACLLLCGNFKLHL